MWLRLPCVASLLLESILPRLPGPGPPASAPCLHLNELQAFGTDQQSSHQRPRDPETQRQLTPEHLSEFAS